VGGIAKVRIPVIRIVVRIIVASFVCVFCLSFMLLIGIGGRGYKRMMDDGFSFFGGVVRGVRGGW
jgi:hypothetical protein